jgi:hypothetical protein
MLLQLKKEEDGKSSLTYIREDGSRTWMHVTPYFAQHDLLHYALESVLGYTQAFMGLIASGKDLTDFERGAKHWLPLEAHWAEIIAGVLQSQMVGSATPAEFAWSVKAGCDGLGVPEPLNLSEDLRTKIMNLHAALLAEWLSVRVGGTLELEWPNAKIWPMRVGGAGTAMDIG